MQIIKGIHYQTKEPIMVETEKGSIKRITVLQKNEIENLPFIAPGLVDLQINGYSGIDFNSENLTVKEVHDINDQLLAQGVTTYFPTVITNSRERILKSLSTIAQACSSSKLVDNCVAGIHLEGPFISLQEGPVGAHDQQYVCAPDWGLFQEFYQASAKKIKIITLSPEWPEAAGFTKKCVQQGTLVAIGHTAASSAQIKAVVDAGAKMSTHLGNGSHQVLPRHPNYIWDQLADGRLSACIIGDGFHLPGSVIKVIQKVKGDQTILVSDSVSLAGLPAGNYNTPVGGQVVLTPQGKLHLAGKPGVLAGSAQTLLQAITNLCRQKQYALADAWNMASLNPARLLNKPVQHSLQEGAPADLVLFHQHNKNLHVLATYKNGVLVFNADKRLN